MLYSGSTKPLYEQLKEILKEKIVNGEYKINQPLPGERQLINIYGVSRMTVRQALSALVNEGLVYRRHGKGTFVTSRRIERPLARLLGIAEELAVEGISVNITVIDKGYQMANEEVREKLNLVAAEQVFYVIRLITSNEQPILIDYKFFSKQVGRIFENIDLSKDLIYNQLELYGYKLYNANQSIRASLSSQEVSKYLQCKPGSPVLDVKRVTFLGSGQPINFSHAIYRGDIYEYNINLYRHPLTHSTL